MGKCGRDEIAPRALKHCDIVRNEEKQRALVCVVANEHIHVLVVCALAHEVHRVVWNNRPIHGREPPHPAVEQQSALRRQRLLYRSGRERPQTLEPIALRAHMHCVCVVCCVLCCVRVGVLT